MRLFSISAIATLLLLSHFGLETRSATAQDSAVSLKGLNSATDWPWWRGPNRDGTAPASAGPATKFGNAENVLWKVPIDGRGHSSPIIVGNKVFLATADEAQQVHSVVCIELATGNQLWQREINRGGFPEKNHPKNTEASSTIACDGESLYATFFHHKMIALTAMDFEGQTKWQIDVGPHNPKAFQYGYAASPVVYQDSIIVAAEHDGTSYIAAFDRANGKEIWRAPRKPTISFSSPVVANIGGRDQLLISGAGQMSSYDPGNGKLLWQTRGTAQATCGTAIWSGNLVIASGGYPESDTVAVAADGGHEVVWRNSQKCYEQSMIAVDGYIYALTDRGILYCWRATDGTEMWRERLAGPVSASPVYAGGNIYWANEGGTIYVFKPNSEKFQLVAENRLGDDIFASPAVTGSLMLWRIAEKKGDVRQEYLVCVGEG